MQISTQLSNAQMTVTFSGKLVFSENGAFRKLLDDVGGSGAQGCIFDFNGLDAIDSSGLGMIMIAIDASKRQGWKLSVRNARGPVAELLRLSRLDTLLAA